MTPPGQQAVCGKIHLGPVDVPVPEGLPQTCQACGRTLTAEERLAYWRVRKTMLELKVLALRAAAKDIK